MNLTKRLLACAAYVRVGCTVADIGTDHALLPCWLAKQGHAVVAADVNEKPLQRAAKTVAQQGQSSRVQLRLSNGLQGIAPAEAEDIILAGMGGELIFRILVECPWTKEASRRFILQPMTQADLLRKTLAAAGYAVGDETAIEENGHFYTVLCVAWEGTQREITAREAWGGRHLDKDDEASKAYLSHQRKKILRIAAGLSRSAVSAGEAADWMALAETLT